MKGRYTKQKGFSLLEALLAIVIIVAAGLGVVELFISADKKNKAEATQTIVQQAASAMSQLLSASYNSTDLDTQDVVKSGLMPSTYITSAGGIIGPYGAFEVKQGTGNSQYYVIAETIPADQAVSICNNMFASAAVSASASSVPATTYVESVADCQSTFGKGSTSKQEMAFSFPREDFITNSTSSSS